MFSTEIKHSEFYFFRAIVDKTDCVLLQEDLTAFVYGLEMNIANVKFLDYPKKIVFKMY